MHNFDQLLESALFEDSTKMQPAVRSKLWQLEQDLKKVNARCTMTSGMGERYFYNVRKRGDTLRQIAKFRTLTDHEKQDVAQAEAITKKYFSPVRESNETRLLASVLQKLDANPSNMPYNTYWTDMHVIVGRFGLTPDEALALSNNKAYKKVQNGHEIDRNLLKLGASRPDVPTKKNLRHAELAGTSDRNREEVGTYYEEEEKDKKPTCVACGGTGKSSTGRPREPCRLRKIRDTERKN